MQYVLFLSDSSSFPSMKSNEAIASSGNTSSNRIFSITVFVERNCASVPWFSLRIWLSQITAHVFWFVVVPASQLSATNFESIVELCGPLVSRSCGLKLQCKWWQRSESGKALLHFCRRCFFVAVDSLKQYPIRTFPSIHLIMHQSTSLLLIECVGF